MLTFHFRSSSYFTIQRVEGKMMANALEVWLICCSLEIIPKWILGHLSAQSVKGWTVQEEAG